MKHDATKKNNLMHTILSWARRFALIFVGTFVAAVGLEFLLLPEGILDGGIVGISIMIEHATGAPLAILTFALNIPFLILGYKQIGRTFLISSLFAIAAFSIWLAVLKTLHYELVQDITLAAIFGGIVLGAGVGIVIRFGGSLDGTEMVAIILSRKLPVSVGQCVLIFNVIIFGVAAFVFTPEKALYSLVTYFIASKVIDIVVDGPEEARCFMIVSEKHDEVAAAILEQLGRSVTFLDGEGSYMRRTVKVIYIVVTRLEVSKLRTVVLESDDSAFITVSNVADVHGGSMHKRNAH